MNIIFAILAILCGVVLLLGMDTGDLEPIKVAGVGIIFAALAAITPRTWPV
jgi:hypothetical protein